MLHHVVELHVVALELCQASRRVRWKTLDSLPSTNLIQLVVEENFIASNILKYYYYIPIYLPHIFKGCIYEPINNVFSCWGKTLSPWYYLPRDDSRMNVEHLEEWQFTGEYWSNHTCRIILSYIDCIWIEPGPTQGEKPLANRLVQGPTNFRKIWEAPQNPRR